MAHFKNRRPKPYRGHCGMCCLQYSDGTRNGRTPTLAEQRADDREAAQREYVAAPDWDDDCGGERFCEGCWEGAGIVECEEHPRTEEPAPLRVPLGDLARGAA